MKRRTRIMKELETSEVVLARLREERALLDAKIAQLEERRQADVLQLIVDSATRFNLAQLPAASIVAGLELLAQSACVDRPVLDPGGTDANSSDDPQEELVPVIVRLTRNTSAVNRVMLENAGVRWNGRAAGWSGRVTRTPCGTCARSSPVASRDPIWAAPTAIRRMKPVRRPKPIGGRPRRRMSSRPSWRPTPSRRQRTAPWT